LVSIKELYYDARPTKSEDLHFKTSKTDIPLQANLILCNLYKKIVYQVGINKGIILRCTAYQISKFALKNKQNRYSITSELNFM